MPSPANPTTAAAPTTATTYSPALRALLPLLYVGWADRRLTRDELQLLRDRVDALRWLSPGERSQLLLWGDPRNPPSRELHHHWAALIHEAADGADRETRESLAALGLATARRALARGEQFGDDVDADEVLAALRELEGIVGPVDPATVDALTPTPETEEPTSGRPDYALDVDAMRRLLDDDHAELRDRMRTLLGEEVFAYGESPMKEDHRARVFSQVERLAEEGLGALALPAEYGGEDDFAAYSAVFEMLGYHDGSVAIKFGVQFGLFAGSIANLGTERHHRDYLAEAGRMALLGCFAMTETGHGSNVRGLETTITYLPDDDAFEVHSPHWGAGKEYIGNALDATLATVFGQLIVAGESHGVHAVLVPLRDVATHALLPGVTVEDSGYKMGLNGVDNGRIWFDRVRVPREALLNRFGDVDAAGRYTSPIAKPGKRFFTMLGTLVGGRCCVPRAGLSAAKAGLAIAVNYGLRRRQFAPEPTLPETLLLDYPSHQRRLLPLVAKAYALDCALDWLNERYAERTADTMRELETQAAAMKAYATWYTTEALQECREACGGKGYLLANRIGQRKGDTEIYTTFEGDNTVLCYLVARSLLTKFRQDFRDEGTFGVLRFVAGRIQDQFTQLNPVSVRNTDSEHLRSAGWQLDALRFRENRMLYSVAQRIQRKVKGGMPSAEAVTLVQPHLKALALAYAERLTLERFVAQEERLRAAGEALAEQIGLLRALYALDAVERDRAWWLEYDFLSSAKSKAVRREVGALCGEARPLASGLVDAFGIPRAVLGARVV